VLGPVYLGRRSAAHGVGPIRRKTKYLRLGRHRVVERLESLIGSRARRKKATVARFERYWPKLRHKSLNELPILIVPGGRGQGKTTNEIFRSKAVAADAVLGAAAFGLPETPH